MRQRRSMLALAPLLLSLGLIAGCGQPTPTGGTPASGRPGPGQGGPAPAPSVQLTTVHMNLVTVKVPAGWTKTTIGGTGDWGGYRFANPANVHQQVTIVSSGCVGCYTDLQGNVSPQRVVPETDATHVTVFNHGLSASYETPAPSAGYAGSGVVTVSSNGSGYGYVEVHLPSNQSALAQQIEASFRLTNAGA